METIRFDDVDQLKSKISTEYSGWSQQVEVTQEKINQFADVTGDHQWIHIDIERSRRESPFKGPVAHGFLTLSLIPAFDIDAGYKVTGYRNVINYGANKLRFPSPVPVGSRVRAGVELLAVTPVSMGYQVATRVTIEREGGDKPACVVEMLAVVVP